MKKEIAKELTKHNMVFCDFIGVFFFQLKKKNILHFGYMIFW